MAPGRVSSFWRGLDIQWRVVGPLIIREIYTRFGRESLGLDALLLPVPDVLRFYLVDWVPPSLRNVALYQPHTQAHEMIRGGVFGTTITTYGDPAYTTFALAILTLFGLWLMRDSRKYVVIE